MASSTHQQPHHRKGTERKQHPGVITWTTMALLITTAVASLRGLPASATYGMASIFVYVLPALIFLVPTALVSAELGSAWKGGVFVWVKEAFGERWGFSAIWQQWIQNVVWYPTQLAFGAAALAYIFNPDLATNGYYTSMIILIVYWLSTLLALRGLDISAFVGSRGLLIGTLLPGAVLVVLALIWIFGAHPVAMPVGAQYLLPPWAGLASIVLIVSNFLQYAGMEVNAVHVNEMPDQKKDYTRAVALACILILLIFIPPTLAISTVIPASGINLSSGVMQAFQIFFSSFGVPWMTAILGALVFIGVLASVVTWIAGPSRGLLLVGEEGYLPRWFQHVNGAGIQSHILAVQGLIVTVLALLFAFLPSVSAAFWWLTTIAAQLYLIMYMMMFLAALRLRRTRANVARGFRVPAMSFFGWLGFIASLLAFLLGFYPPTQAAGIPIELYILSLVVGIIILACGPFIFSAMRKPSWKEETARGGRIEPSAL